LAEIKYSVSVSVSVQRPSYQSIV